ncbi:hypothetical protein [Neorhodopirellula lusitana]|uniref:hypothetical protein n=1 Tax=Neorhodopirellula lusitana TaxID=445327 RepID=UPI00384DED58
MADFTSQVPQAAGQTQASPSLAATLSAQQALSAAQVSPAAHVLPAEQVSPAAQVLPAEQVSPAEHVLLAVQASPAAQVFEASADAFSTSVARADERLATKQATSAKPNKRDNFMGNSQTKGY